MNSEKSLASVDLSPSEWCSMKDLARLDTSFCNKSKREPFLSTMKSFEMSGGKTFNMSVLEWIMLRQIPVRAIEFDSSKVKTLVNLNCSKLIYLEVRSCNAKVLSQRMLIGFWNSCPKLKSICFDKVDCVMDKMFREINKTVRSQLTRIEIKNCPEIAGTFFPDLIGCDLTHLSVVFNNRTNIYTADWITDLLVMTPKLQKLSLEFRLNLQETDELLKCVAVNCRSIQNIRLKYVDQPSLEVCSKVIETCKSLKYFSTLDNVFFPQRKQVVFYFSTKDRVEPSNKTARCVTITGFEPQGWRSTEMPSVAHFFTTSFDFTEMSLDSLAYGVSDTVLSVIADKCPRLKAYSIENCGRAFTAVGLQAIMCACPLIESVEWSECSHVSNASLVALFATCKKLITLCFTNHVTLDIDTLLQIANANPQLIAIGTRGCRGVREENEEGVRGLYPKLLVEFK